MIGIEVVAGGVIIYLVKRQYTIDGPMECFGTGGIRYCSKQQIDSQDGTAPSAQVVKDKLIELAELGKHTDPTNDFKDDPQQSEEEIFGSGVWGVDFHNIKYRDESVTSVSLYEETIKPRAIFPIIHPYILVETPTWMYVLEKWRDGIAVSRFKKKDDAVRSRGKWFGPGRLSQRKMPHLVQATTEVKGLTTTGLLVWTMDHPYFKQYTDNCHTFAANLSKKVGMKNPNSYFEELMYDNY
eukprot:NODE_2395_length_932_cov_194.255946_g1970_i0.p1 GENE.NODE_2395_length_932_cov_194.255946_g1970_i0~~NODE_2395_length_932_cov_194.255946_g1970_i0.p1  ORF type:complete len:253 (+),score=50.93 NODE_2395_length_932_cov_194.255946_g1970_i0:40-759(+)